MREKPLKPREVEKLIKKVDLIVGSSQLNRIDNKNIESMLRNNIFSRAERDGYDFGGAENRERMAIEIAQMYKNYQILVSEFHSAHQVANSNYRKPTREERKKSDELEGVMHKYKQLFQSKIGEIAERRLRTWKR